MVCGWTKLQLIYSGSWALTLIGVGAARDRKSSDHCKMTARAVLISPLGDASFTEKNPFKVAEEIRAISGEIESCKPPPNRSLLIKTATPEQAERLLKTGRFLGFPVRCSCTSADKHHTVEAVAFVPSLVTVSEKEIATHLRPQI